MLVVANRSAVVIVVVSPGGNSAVVPVGMASVVDNKFIVLVGVVFIVVDVIGLPVTTDLVVSVSRVGPGTLSVAVIDNKVDVRSAIVAEMLLLSVLVDVALIGAVVIAIVVSEMLVFVLVIVLLDVLVIPSVGFVSNPVVSPIVSADTPLVNVVIVSVDGCDVGVGPPTVV